MHLLLLILVGLIMILTATASKKILISPMPGCSFNCLGDSSEPFDNLLIAINQTYSDPDVEFLLMSFDEYPHFLLTSEIVSGITRYNQLGNINVNQNIVIRPLYCDEDLITDNSTLNQYCSERNEKVILYVKDENTHIKSRYNVTLENVIIDGTEDIYKYNNPSTNLETCLTSRIRCCSGDYQVSELFSDVSCQAEDLSFSYISSSGALFEISKDPLLTSTTFRLIGTTFQNHYFKSSGGLFKIGDLKNLEIINSSFKNNYFPSGVISPLIDVISVDSLNILLDGVIFSGYNLRCYKTDLMDSEGYFFNFPFITNSNIQIQNSSFEKAASAVMQECPSLTLDKFQRPLNAFVISNPFSRSDICSNYLADHSKNRTGSLFFLGQFYGNLSVISSQFRHIIGLSGSVFSIKKVTNVALSSFLFQNSIFDGNFAFYGFAAISIFQDISNYLNSIKLSKVIIDNCTFSNHRGCPGSMGTVLIQGTNSLNSTCSKDGLLTTSITSERTNFKNYMTSLSSQAPLVNVINSLFFNNTLIVSNSLAIIGFPYVRISGNSFIRNGHYLLSYGTQTLKESFWGQLYPSKANLINDKDGFQSASALYIQFGLAVDISNNLFDSNWALFSASWIPGSSLTLKNQFMFSDFIRLQHNIFTNHGILPSDITSQLTAYPIVAANQEFWMPVITFSLFEKYCAELKSIISNIDVTLRFENNTVKDNIFPQPQNGKQYTSTTIGNSQWQSYHTEINNDRHQNFLKFLTTYEDNDSGVVTSITPDFADSSTRITLSLTNSKFINNTFVYRGCIIPSMIPNTVIMTGVQISQNKINIIEDNFFSSTSTSKITYDEILIAVKYGVICGANQGYYTAPKATVSWTIQNVNISHNKGIVMNFEPNEGHSLIVDSVLISENVCESYSTIIYYSSKTLIFRNSQILNNLNRLGVIFFHGLTFSGRNNIYQGNSGFYSTLYLIDNSQFTDENPKIYENSVNPPHPLFGVQPQGALITLVGGRLTIRGAEMKNNTSTGGLINAAEATITIDTTTITENNFAGLVLLGTFISQSKVTFTNSFITNNQLANHPDPLTSSLTGGIIVGYTSTFTLTNIVFENNTIFGGYTLIYLSSPTFTMQGSRFVNNTKTLTQESQDDMLIFASFGTFSVTKTSFINCSNVFHFISVTALLTEIDFKDMKPVDDSLQLINSYISTLTLDTIFITQDLSALTDAPRFSNLVKGSSTKWVASNFILENSRGEEGNLFDFSNSEVSFINSTFTNAYFENDGSILRLQTGTSLNMSSCNFSDSATLLSDTSGTKITLKDIEVETIMRSDHLFKFDTSRTIDINNLKVQITEKESQSQDPTSLLYLFNTKTVNMLNSQILGSRSSSGAIVIHHSTIEGNLLIENVVFQNNTATGLGGGAITIEESKSSHFNIVNCLFNSNKALSLSGNVGGKGGSIYINTIDENFPVYSFTGCTFSDNIADHFGGALYFINVAPIFDANTVFDRNYARGIKNHIGSHATQLKYIKDIDSYKEAKDPTKSPARVLNEDSVLIEGVASGLTIETNYTFALLDLYGQVTLDDSSSEMEIIPTAKEFTSTISTVSATRGVFQIENVVFNFKPGQETQVIFRSSGVKIFKSSPNEAKDSLNVQLKFRNCGIGEYVLDDKCIRCKPGEMLINLEENSAGPCVECYNSLYCNGGSNVSPKPGFWRMNETANLVLECKTIACLGGKLEDGTFLPVTRCAPGYQGNLCHNCIKGWAKTSNNAACFDCNNNPNYYIQLAIAIIINLALIGYSVKVTLEQAKDYTFESEHKNLDVKKSILVRNLVNYIQVVSLIGDLPLAWPSSFKSSLKFNKSMPSPSSDMFSLDCFYSDNEEAYGTPKVFLKMIIVNITPFFFEILAILFWLIWYLKKRQKIGKDFFNIVMTTFVIITFNLQSNLINATLKAFQCENLYRDDTPEYYLRDNYDTKCWTKEHFLWIFLFALPAVLFWAVILPLWVFLLIRKHRNELSNDRIKLKYSFLYRGYKQEKYYWEFVILIRKYALIALSVFGAFHSPQLQVYLSLYIIFISYYYHLKHRPYLNARLNELEKISLASSGVVNLAGLYFELVKSTDGLDEIFLAVAIIGNFYYFFHWLVEFIKTQGQVLRKAATKNKKVYKIFNKIWNCCPGFWSKLYKKDSFEGFIADDKYESRTKTRYSVASLETKRVRALLNEDLAKKNDKADEALKIEIEYQKERSSKSQTHKPSTEDSIEEEMKQNKSDSRHNTSRKEEQNKQNHLQTPIQLIRLDISHTIQETDRSEYDKAADDLTHLRPGQNPLKDHSNLKTEILILTDENNQSPIGTITNLVHPEVSHSENEDGYHHGEGLEIPSHQTADNQKESFLEVPEKEKRTEMSQSVIVLNFPDFEN